MCNFRDGICKALDRADDKYESDEDMNSSDGGDDC